MRAKSNAAAGFGNAAANLSNADRQARFKANKQFKSLPLDVQHSIDRISSSPEARAARIAIATDYADRHPESACKGIDYEAEPMSAALPGSPEYKPHSGPDEYCDSCDRVLPRLERPRKYPGMCLRCATGAMA